MSWTLLVLGHGRWSYLSRTLAALNEAVDPSIWDRQILSVDGRYEDVPGRYRSTSIGEVVCTGGRKGLTANVQQAWDQLGPSEWVFHLEEDFLVHDAPLPVMRSVLEANPSVAQMVLERQPVNPAEQANGGLLGADNIPTWESRTCYFPSGFHCYWREQAHLFSFNPCVYHSSVATVAGTETVVADRLRAGGRTFGFWGAQGDAPRCTHIGTEGGMGSAGWAA